MSENATMKDLAITIQTEGSLLTLTPRGLLEYYLPQATELRPGVWQGKSSTGKPVYLQTEVLAGALLDCKEKQLNPITDIYLLPSTSPERKASHKVKYTVGLERMREMPGFLGLNSGLLVLNGGNVQRRTGRACYPGDEPFGAWAKAYFQGGSEPIEHEVDLQSCEVEGSPTWKDRPGFMLLKVVEDELWRLKVLPRMRPREREAIEGEAIILEGSPLREVPKASRENPKPTAPQAPKQDTKPDPFVAGELYTGRITHLLGPGLLDKSGKQTAKSTPGNVHIELPDRSKLKCIYWTPPEALRHPEIWPDLLGKHAAMSFREKRNEQGVVFRFVDTLDILTDAPPVVVSGDWPPDDEPSSAQLDPARQSDAMPTQAEGTI